MNWRLPELGRKSEKNSGGYSIQRDENLFPWVGTGESSVLERHLSAASRLSPLPTFSAPANVFDLRDDLSLEVDRPIHPSLLLRNFHHVLAWCPGVPTSAEHDKCPMIASILGFESVVCAMHFSAAAASVVFSSPRTSLSGDILTRKSNAKSMRTDLFPGPIWKCRLNDAWTSGKINSALCTLSAGKRVSGRSETLPMWWRRFAVLCVNYEDVRSWKRTKQTQFSSSLHAFLDVNVCQ